MRKTFVIGSVLLLMCILSGCNKTNENTVLLGDKPPKMTIEVNREEFNSQLGSYCWNLPDSESECLEIMVPLENGQRIAASLGEEISLTFKSAPAPDQAYLIQNPGDDLTEVKLNENQFTAPDEKGVYYYVYSVAWLNKDEEKVSNGSVDYGFILDIK
ncbi:hypothetical protein [Amphibacillus indicireducens]|uniref:Lipoprotein n=1 Tax=Amphibacillus indicireducens TaxID=1076330 RepID=A0ABP7VAV5_9BACI